MRKPFTLYKRNTTKKNKYVYYIQFYDEEGNRLTGRSSGQTSKAAAEAWAYNEITCGRIKYKSNLTFTEYADNWFIWDKCEYLKRKRIRGSVSRSHVDSQRRLLEKYILPPFMETKLNKITVDNIESWLISLRDKVSSTTANRALSVLKVMMKETMRLGYIQKNPAALVTKLQERHAEKGLLLRDEVLQVLR